MRAERARQTLRVLTTICLLCGFGACGGEDRLPSPQPDKVLGPPRRPVQEPSGELPAPDDEERLIHAHHLMSVSGELGTAKELLSSIVGRPTVRRSVRARGALALAGLAEVTGDRREALVYLERAKILAGPGHPLALEADDRRAGILTATPFAEVRGPVPGSVVLRSEALQVVARFRAAEQALARFHSVVVAPQLENITDVLHTKRRSLAVAVAAYQKVATTATGPAKAAALFRMGAMYHHLAEALVFAIPPELLPSMARQLRRQLQAESTSYLRKSLSYYREAAAVMPGPGTSPWRQLAEREAKTLALVLKAPRRRGK